MCLAIPGEIKDISGSEAVVDYGGVSMQANLQLVENASVGDIVLVHAGFVIQILDKDDGNELQKLIEEAMRFI
jgi:hydrogenase expression/formation protein HypC